MNIDDAATIKTLAGLGGIGGLAGLGSLLASNERLTLRLISGRAAASGVLGVASATTLVFIPDMPDVALYGASAAISSLGTSFLERLASRWLGVR